MEHYQLLKYAHLIPAVLLLAGVIAHAFMLWKAHRAGDAAVITRKLRVTRLYSLPALGLLAVSLPISGWWLTSSTSACSRSSRYFSASRGSLSGVSQDTVCTEPLNPSSRRTNSAVC